MANDVANIILKKAIEMQDRDDEIYFFNGKMYKKKETTSHNEFIRSIIEKNYDKCVKLLFKQRQKIGPYIDQGGAIEGVISLKYWENTIDLHDFHLTADEYKNLVLSFEKNNWKVNLMQTCFHSRHCLCDTSRSWIFKNKEDDIYFEDGGENNVPELKVNEENERVVWGNQCDICCQFIEMIREDINLCDCTQNIDIYCFCKCKRCNETIQSKITFKPDQYYSDHCGLFKNDIYDIFISTKIDILKKECVDIIEKYIQPKKLEIV